MSTLEPQEVCKLVPVEDASDFQAFLQTHPSGLVMVPEKHGNLDRPVLMSDAGDFAKWLKSSHPEIQVEIRRADCLSLHSSDLWLPLVFLATDVGLPLYLNLVANYLYDRIKGALRGEKPRVHLSAEYQDGATGALKRFTFEGDGQALRDAMKKLDLNQFFDG